MRVKLDENLGVRGAQILEDGGCDVATVVAEDLCSSSILRFPPRHYAGIVVLRLPEPLTPASIEDALRRFLEGAAGKDLVRRLWVVDAHRIREFEAPESPGYD